jgi:hypothetical protein
VERLGRGADGDFYTRFSSDANVSRARVTEIQALKLATHYGATNRLADLDAREQAVLADTNAPEELRYRIAAGPARARVAGARRRRART